MEVSGQNDTLAALPPEKKVPIERVDGWSPHPVWTIRGTETLLAPVGIASPNRPARS